MPIYHQIYLIGSSEYVLIQGITAWWHIVELPTFVEKQVKACIINICEIFFCDSIQLQNILMKHLYILIDHLFCCISRVG